MSLLTKKWLPIPAVAVVGVAVTFAFGSGTASQHLLSLVLIWATVGLSWNILGGYAGQLSFGHALYFGIGALVNVLLAKEFDVSPVMSVVPAVVLAVIVALVLGWPTFRLAGIYFSLATLVFPLIMRPVLNFVGLQETSVPFRQENAGWYLQFSDPRMLTLVALLALVIGVAVTLAVQHSRFGAALVAVRENEPAARAAGVNARLLKQGAYAISAGLAAVAGVLYAQVLLVVTPDSVFGLIVSVQAMVIPLVGGRATVWGPIIGAALLVTLSDTLISAFGSQLPGVNGVLYGVAIIVLVFLAPEGVYWKVADLVRRRFPQREETPRDPVPDAPLVAPRDGTPGEPVLEVAGVRKSFRGLRVLEDVSFTVGRGEIVGVIGPNGAGKTTLFNVVNGFVRADSGSVRFDGKELVGRSTHAVARLGVARTFQVVRQLPRETLLGNVRITALRSGRTVRDAEVRARQALAAVGLAERVDEPVTGLGARELRLMELARAVAADPVLLLADEILAGLDDSDIDDITAVLRGLRDAGLTIVIIEHTMSAMKELADRLVVLDEGKVIADGVPLDVLADSRVVEAYLGRKWVAAHADD